MMGFRTVTIAAASSFVMLCLGFGLRATSSVAKYDRIATASHSEPVPKKVAILIFPGVEIIDYTGPWEVFGSAGYEVFTVAASPAKIKTYMGMTVVPDYTFANCPDADILLLPGGAVRHQIPQTDATLQWVKSRSPKARQIMSVCNGAFWLANAGLLDGKEVTTTNGWIPTLSNEFPNVKVTREKRFTDNGQIMTTGGLTAGIDGALHLVEKLEGRPISTSIALGLEYNFSANASYVRATLADRYLARLGHLALPPGCTVSDLKNEGDANHWILEGLITNKTTPAAELIAAVTKSVGDSLTKAGLQKGELDWRFQGDDGKPWKVTLTVRPGEKTGEYIETVLLDRASS